MLNPMSAPKETALTAEILQSSDGGDNRVLFNGMKGPHRDIVMLNAAAALVVAEKADDLAAGLELAAQAIDSGSAAGTLKRLVEISEAQS